MILFPSISSKLPIILDFENSFTLIHMGIGSLVINEKIFNKILSHLNNEMTMRYYKFTYNYYFDLIVD